MTQIELPSNAVFLDEITAWGHENVLSTHPTTLEVTTEQFLTLRGNCIIGVSSTKGVEDFHPNLKNAIVEGKKLLFLLIAGPFQDCVIGFGHPGLTLSNPISLVLRKSDFLSDRTALVGCDKASCDISRELVQYLQDPSHSLTIKIYTFLED